MDYYAFRILKRQPFRLLLTISGIALCIILMLFLLGVYRGVKEGSVQYIRQNKADLWVLQQNSWNILRGSSLLSTGHGKLMEELPGVEMAAPVLLILSGIKKEDQIATVFLTGFDPRKVLGGPPRISVGRSVKNDNEIVLDKSFAAKFHFRVGDRVQIQDYTLQVVGLSSGTNAFVIQYAFTTLRRVQSIIRFPSLTTCFLIRVKKGYTTSAVADSIREELPGLEVFDRQTFLQNNIKEMETGFLPLLYTVAVIGMVVLTAILSLLLSINILEQRKDLAVLKTLGSPAGFLWRLIIDQALFLMGTATIVALLLFFPLSQFIRHVVPEISTKTSWDQIAAVIFVVVSMSLLSSLISIQRLRQIFPLEAFK